MRYPTIGERVRNASTRTLLPPYARTCFALVPPVVDAHEAGTPVKGIGAVHEEGIACFRAHACGGKCTSRERAALIMLISFVLFAFLLLARAF
jgi:hypothetical protein